MAPPPREPKRVRNGEAYGAQANEAILLQWIRYVRVAMSSQCDHGVLSYPTFPVIRPLPDFPELVPDNSDARHDTDWVTSKYSPHAAKIGRTS